MRHDDVTRLLDEFLDGVLGPDEAAAVEEHVGECAECRADMEELRTLLDEAAELPRSIEPARDLWPEIDARLDVTPLRERSLWSMRYPLAAAAVVLIAISSVVTNYVVGDRDARRGGPPGSAVGVSLVSQWQVTESEYLRATEELLEAMEAVKGQLPAETVVMLEDNLRIIDEAIRESRAALELDPVNGELMEMLSSVYRTKIEVLQGVSRLAARS